MDLHDVRKNLIENYFNVYDVLLDDKHLIFSNTEHTRALGAAKLLLEAAALLQNDCIYNSFNQKQEGK